MLLPLALAAGEEASRMITVPVPPVAGTDEVTIALAETPALVLARHAVQVRSDDPLDGAPRRTDP